MILGRFDRLMEVLPECQAIAWSVALSAGVLTIIVASTR
jgi:hypothetical protein